MNDLAKDPESAGPGGNGPNLILIYGLMALAIVVAMAFAAMIVYPFYLRR